MSSAPPSPTPAPAQPMNWAHWVRNRSVQAYQFILSLVSVVSISVPIVLFISYALYSDWAIESHVANQFHQPSSEELVRYEKGPFVERPLLEERLEFMLSNMMDNYILVWGENGVGKTSTVVKVIRERLRKKGIPVFYLEAEENGFEKKMVDKLGLAPSSVISSILEYFKLKYTTPHYLEILKRATKMMKQMSGHRPVLVIDACNKLEANEEGSEFLRMLQNWAKVEADERGMHVVFVSSDGKAPAALSSRGVASRMLPIRIHEATDDEAREYLQKVKGVQDKEELDHAVSTAGGVFKYLTKYPELESVRTTIDRKLQYHGFTMDNPEFVAASRSILKYGKISALDFYQTFGGSKKAMEILKTNAFLYDSNTRTVSFQNRPTRTFISAMITEKDAKEKEEEAKRQAKEKEEEAKRLAKEKEEEAKRLAKEKEEEAKRLAKEKEEEAKRLAKEREEEAKRLAKEKEEFINLAKEEEQALQNPSLVSVCRTILDHGSIPYEVFVDAVGGFDSAHQQLRGLLFAFDDKDMRVTFQSVITHRRLAEKLSVPQKESNTRRMA